MIRLILDHGSESGSPQRNAPLDMGFFMISLGLLTHSSNVPSNVYRFRRVLNGKSAYFCVFGDFVHMIPGIQLDYTRVNPRLCKICQVIVNMFLPKISSRIITYRQSLVETCKRPPRSKHFLWSKTKLVIRCV